MATWLEADIKAAYDEGERLGATHMIVAWDSFSGDNYPIYVMPGEDPRSKVPTNGDSVDECYRYALGWESQSKEHRARHFEWDPPKPVEPKYTKGSEVKIATSIELRHGVVLPYTIPAYPSLGREAESGETFVSISDLEDLQDTEAFGSHVIGLRREAEQAVIDAGWAVKATRGGLYATEVFRERKDDTSVLGEIIDLSEPVWAEERADRARAIWKALTDDERARIAQIVREEGA